MSKLKWTVVISSLALLIVTGYLVKNHIRPYNITSVLSEKDPVYLRYKEHLQKYNDENDVYLLIESEKSFLQRSDFFQIVFETSERLKWIPDLETVTSLNEAEYLKNTDDRVLLKKFFIDKKIPDEAANLLKASPLFKYSYLSPDEKATMIYVSIKNDLTQAESKQVFSNLNQIKNIVDRSYPGVKAHLLGTEIARNYFLQEIVKSQAKILPVVLAIILLLLYSLFRTWKVCMLAMYVMGISYFCTICLIILLEGSINPFSSFALLFIFIISTADIVHLFSALKSAEGTDLSQKFKSAITEIWRPCFICALTTWIGLLSLVVADIPPIRYFGIYCAFGVAICFYLTFYFIPWVVNVFKINLEFKEPLVKFQNIEILHFVRRHRRKIVFLFLTVMIGFSYLSSSLEAGDNIYKKFVKNHPLSLAADSFDKYFKFTGSIDLVLKKERSEFLNLETEKKLLDLQNKILKLEKVAHVKSLSNYQQYIRSQFPLKGQNASFQNDDKLSEVFNLFEDFEIMSSYYPYGLSETRISIFLKSMDSKTLEEAKSEIEDLMNTLNIKKDFDWSLEGFSTVRSAIFSSILSGFIKSFLLDFIGIFLCFIFFFRSFFWAVLAIIPNILPLVTCGGLMHLLGMNVDYNLIVLVAIIFGIAVDDTTHFIFYLLKDYRRTGDLDDALAYSLKKTSVALISTTFIFSLTLPAFFLTDISMFSQVAIILILSLVLGLSGDMFVLPALLYSRRLKKFIKYLQKINLKGPLYERS